MWILQSVPLQKSGYNQIEKMMSIEGTLVEPIRNHFSHLGIRSSLGIDGISATLRQLLVNEWLGPDMDYYHGPFLRFVIRADKSFFRRLKASLAWFERHWTYNSREN